MCELLIRRADNQIIRCEANGFGWGAMESHAAFVASHRQFGVWPGKLYLIKCAAMSAPEGETLVGRIYTGEHVEYEVQIDPLTLLGATSG